MQEDDLLGKFTKKEKMQENDLLVFRLIRNLFHENVTAFQCDTFIINSLLPRFFTLFVCKFKVYQLFYVVQHST